MKKQLSKGALLGSIIAFLIVFSLSLVDQIKLVLDGQCNMQGMAVLESIAMGVLGALMGAAIGAGIAYLITLINE